MKKNSYAFFAPMPVRVIFLLALVGSSSRAALAAPAADQTVASPVAVLANENVEAAARQDVKKARGWGKAIGIGVGTVVGILVAKNNGNNNLEKTAIVAGGVGAGALVGDQVGKAIGERIAARRRQYASEQAFLESEIQTANAAIATRERKLAETDEATRQRQAQIADLEKSTQLTREQKTAASQMLADVNQKVEENTRLLKEYEDAVAYLDETLKTSTPEAAASAAETAKWEEKKKGLEAKRAELVAQQDRLQGVGQGLEVDQRRLLALAGH